MKKDSNTIEESYEALKKAHAGNLDAYGVELPELRKHNGAYNNGALQLIYLYKNLGEPCQRDEISAFVKIHQPTASADQQPRHLKYSGWDVRLSGKSGDKLPGGERVPNGCNVLCSVEYPSPRFLAMRLKRAGRVAAKDWRELVMAYGSKCAMCKCSNKPLEKGHMDPHSGDRLGNLVPLCGDCNNWASSDVVLDEHGRVKALASPRLVLESSEAVQQEILLALQKVFKTSKRSNR